MPTIDDRLGGLRVLSPGLMDFQLGAATDEALDPNAMYLNGATGKLAATGVTPRKRACNEAVLSSRVKTRNCWLICVARVWTQEGRAAQHPARSL